MVAEKRTTHSMRIVGLAVGAGILILAYRLTTVAGARGFYPFDQSIVFDGSYRVLTGQVPYRDFIAPFGPVTFWLHAFFFRLFGTTYQAYIVGAGVVNAVAAAIAMLTVRTLFPRLRLLPVVAGVLTAVWFYPPFGTPWVDQTAFLLVLLAVWATVGGLTSDPGDARRAWGLAVAGCFSVLAFLSKQNVGSFIVLLFPLLMLSVARGQGRRLLKDIGLFALGGAGTAAVFTVWLVLQSDTGTFVRHVLVIPSELGRERIGEFAETWFGTVRPFFGGRGPAVVMIAVWGSLIVGAAALISHSAKSGRAPLSRRHSLAALLCTYLAAFQHVFINTTLNQPENGLAFSGTVIALAAGLLLSYTPLGRRKAGVASAAAMAVFLIFAARTGYRVAMSRDVHEMFRGADFEAPVGIEGLEGLRWAEPNSIRGSVVLPEHLVTLHGYLQERGENFFAFPDFTILYGILGVPSPQPLLWFHEGVTYSREENSDLDEAIVTALNRNDVQVYVREQAAWFNTGERLDDFPMLRAFLRTEFVKLGEIGIFSVYERRPRSTP
jgi:hypothetical protein